MRKNYHFGINKVQREAQWKAEFSDIVVTLDSRHAGKIEWPSATHFYNQGLTPREAAETYVKNRM